MFKSLSFYVKYTIRYVIFFLGRVNIFNMVCKFCVIYFMLIPPASSYHTLELSLHLSEPHKYLASFLHILWSCCSLCLQLVSYYWPQLVPQLDLYLGNPTHHSKPTSHHFQTKKSLSPSVETRSHHPSLVCSL